MKKHGWTRWKRMKQPGIPHRKTGTSRPINYRTPMSKKICYLSSRNTLPGAPDRRIDAFEHDQMMDCLRTSLSPHDILIEADAWDNRHTDWSNFSAVIIGTAWDYWDHVDDFLRTLDAISKITPVYNSPDLVRWNLHKQYLKDLAARSIPTIPTHWADQVTPSTLEHARIEFKTDDLVIKRQIGAGGDGQHRLRANDALPSMPHPMMIQPFLPAIQEFGEISVVMIEGIVSHALLKTAADNDYRIQSSYGGREQAYQITSDLRFFAEQVVKALPHAPLYARVDVIPNGQNGWLLMEVELVEPFLYPIQGPKLGALMADALVAQLNRHDSHELRS